MRCLSFRRLLPARKLWKFFTNKLQSRLHRLSKSKTIKKPRSGLSRKVVSLPPFSSLNNHPRARKKRFQLKSGKNQTLISQNRHYFKKSPAPVYIDQLFVETVSVVKEEPMQPPNKAKAVSDEKEITLPPSAKRVDKEETRFNEPSTSKVVSSSLGNERMHAADDMWESLVLASPQMNGINERAEEFITRFRAEMQRQEKFAHQL